MRELDALRRPGRARRVDQRQQVVGLDRAPVRPRRRSPGRPSTSPRRACLARRRRARSRARAPAARAALNAANAPRRSRPCAPASPTTYAICSGDERQVDRERRRAERHRREVGDVELGPVGEHQRDACRRGARRAARRPPASASTRSRSSRPGQRDLVVLACGPRRGPAWSSTVRRNASAIVARRRAREPGGGAALHGRDATGRTEAAVRSGARCRS